ncbi:hypothetical protein ACHAP7_011830 [Fusarium lateritium]
MDHLMYTSSADPNKKRHNFGARITAKQQYLNSLPTNISDAYRSSGVPFKVINNIAKIVQLVKSQDKDFDLDSLWALGLAYSSSSAFAL